MLAHLSRQLGIKRVMHTDSLFSVHKIISNVGYDTNESHASALVKSIHCNCVGPNVSHVRKGTRVKGAPF